MKRKATHKDFFREIKKSAGRFFSILFIVALGVAFFSGIRASEPDMRRTGDSYFDETNLMDIKLISTLGITEDDIQSFEQLDSIEKAEGAYSADFLIDTEENQFALHIMSLPKEMNKVSVTEGRLPQKVGECLVDDEMDYHVGDKICVRSGTDSAVLDTLKIDEFTVVGTGSSPCYISFNRGSTNIGNGSLKGFLFVPEDTFDLDVYTESYMQVAGAKELMAYTDEYDALIDNAMEQVEELTKERGIIRRRELVDEATKQLDQSKLDLEEGQRQAEEELADAAQEIADAEAELDEAKQKLLDGRRKLSEAKKTLTQKQKELADAKTQYESGAAQLAAGRAQYEEGEAAFKAGEASAQKKIAKGEKGLAQLEAGIKEAQEAYEQIEQTFEQLADLEKRIAEIEASISVSADSVLPQDMAMQYAALQATVAQMKAQIEAQDLETQYKTLPTTIKTLQKQYNKALKEINSAKEKLENTRKELEAAKAELDAGESKLASAFVELQNGQKQIDDGWAEIAKQEKELNDGSAEIEENEEKIADAKKELQEGRIEAEKEIAEGKEKIADAEEEIDDISEAVWYIYDRSTLPEYTGYGENADRMRAIGQVFPVLFFLVAALISLTSMTRMVEEQRVQIGTMKALGYSKGSIAFKYIGYALSATIVGSVLGVLIGEKIFPYIIIYAYGIMYHHMSKILVPYVASYGVAASAAAVACTMAATIFSCYRELGAQAAILMRPPAPKVGKRVLLERIPMLWKRLNFSWKSSVRNLMRYKKRFFMTIFGIGGCMALMVVGYGIRDSIYEITDVQYSQIQMYDGQILLEDDLTEEERQNLNTFLAEDEEIDRSMEVYMKNIMLTKQKAQRQTYIVVFSNLDDVAEYVDFHDRKTKEKYAMDDEGVMISEKTAKLLNVGVGDTVTLQNEDDTDRNVTISHICENYMGHYIYMTPNYYQQVFNEAPTYNSILFAADESFDAQQVAEAGAKIVDREEVLSISYMDDIKEQLDRMLSSLNLVIIVLIISAGMLAFVVLYNLNTINITERQRELATLKVLGFYNPEVASYVFRENVMLTFIGAGVGVILGKVLHAFVIQTVEVDAAMFGRDIKPQSFLYSLLFTVAFSLIINGIMYFKLKKIDMVESLKSIE